MPAPILRHYFATASGTANTATQLVTVPANRALVVSKIVVLPAGTATPVTFRLYINQGTNTDATFAIAYDVTLNAGESYTETGLTVLAGESVSISASQASGVRVAVFGQEVDN